MFASNLSRQSSPLYFFHALVAWFAPVLWKFPVGDCAGLTCFGNWTDFDFSIRVTGQKQDLISWVMTLWPQVGSFGSDDSIAELLDVAAGRCDPAPLNQSWFLLFPGAGAGSALQQNNSESEGCGEDDLLAPKDWTFWGAISASTMFATICAAAIARRLKPGVWRWLLWSPSNVL